jgi:hypothetical protein
LNKLKPIEKPDVFLFGSSLMIFPLWFADHGDNLPDSAYYNFRSKALQNKCTEAHQICNMSLALMSASDANRIVDRYFQGEHAPKVLVYGVGPRDFYDDFSKSPSASVYFNVLSSLDDYSKNSKQYFHSANDELQNIGKRAYFMFAKRAEIVLMGKSLVKQLIHKEKPPASTANVPASDMGPQRNLDEYKGHYKGISADALNPQMQCLDQLLKVCSKRNIRVIVLGMPLTQENRDLLPPHVYQSFTQKLSTLAVANNQKFVDLNNNKFETRDFLDSAHLNATGASKFVDLVATAINAEMAKINGNAGQSKPEL